MGISSHENDYRLSWAINNQLGFEFSQIPNLKIYNDKISEDQDFSMFSYNDESKFIKYYLISNTCENGFLLPEYKNIDFLLLVYGEVSDNDLELLVNKLKNIEIINLAFQVSDLPARIMEKLTIF